MLNIFDNEQKVNAIRNGLWKSNLIEFFFFLDFRIL